MGVAGPHLTVALLELGVGLEREDGGGKLQKMRQAKLSGGVSGLVVLESNHTWVIGCMPFGKARIMDSTWLGSLARE